MSLLVDQLTNTLALQLTRDFKYQKNWILN